MTALRVLSGALLLVLFAVWYLLVMMPDVRGVV